MTTLKLSQCWEAEHKLDKQNFKKFDGKFFSNYV